MNKELLTHAYYYTVIVLDAVGVKVCLIKVLKRNKVLNNEQPNEHKTKARQNKTTAKESAENCSETKSEHLQWRSRKSLRLSTHRASNITNYVTNFCTIKNLHGFTLR